MVTKSVGAGAKRALVIGINAYDPPNALPSCINDADAFAQLLADRYGFQSIANLRDGEASKAGILAGLAKLLEGATPDDELVFYFSGHGYSFQQGDALIEALVPQDADFLTSDDMLAATQGIPSDCLTTVLDSCFSGGMQKAFAKKGGIKVAQVKFWTPPAADIRKAFAPSRAEIKTYKSFGSKPAPITSTTLAAPAATKAFSTVVPEATAGDRQFILLSACQADETAAASTDMTEGKSAFTFSLLKQIDSDGADVGVAQLLDDAGQELRQLGVRQTPMLKVPSTPPQLTERAFLLWDQPIPDSSSSSPLLSDKSFPSTSSPSKGITMSSTTLNKDWLSDIESIVRTVTPIVAGALKDYRPPLKGFEPATQLTSADKGWFDDLTRVVATVVPALVQGMKQYDPPAKGFAPGAAQPFDKGWFDSVTSIVGTLVPVVVSALKDYKAPNGNLADLSDAAKKGWFDDVTGVIANVLPVVLNATKGMQTSGTGAKGFMPPAGNEKGFWDTLGSIAQVAVPVAISLL